MDPLLIGAGAGGLVLGVIIGVVVAKGGAGKVRTELEGRIKEAQQKLESAKKETAAHLEKERARAVDAEKKVGSQKERLTVLEKSVEDHKNKAKQLQSSLEEAQAAQAKATAQIEAQGSARQQAEGRARQAEGMAAEAQQSLQAAQAELQAARGELAELQASADRRNKEVQKLRADLTALRHNAEGGLEESIDVFAETEGNLDKILGRLMEHEGQRAAVMADANGIIVAAVGEGGLKEGMAATAQLVGSMCTQLVGMVPFSSIRAYMLQDMQNNVLAGRAFMCQGEIVGLVTYGSRNPTDRVLDGAMASLNAALE